mmetsp:Transcript_48550/g.96791  ORF Transcript_48550/g.96791 Transcript_48550/m.96791 type:complete len:215 (-) Transcript_48550:580-1224(-)
MWTPLVWIMQRHALSWLFEVLPVCLLTLQSIVALSSGGDVDAWSAQPLFRRVGSGSRSLGRAASGKLADFIGRWSIEERTGMDEFLEALGFASWQRALISRAGQSTTLEQTRNDKGDDALRIITADLRGTSELELPLSGARVEANDGDGGARVARSARLDRSAVIVEEHFPGESEPLSVTRRTVEPDGRMRILVTKRTPTGANVAFQAIAARVG